MLRWGIGFRVITIGKSLNWGSSKRAEGSEIILNRGDFKSSLNRCRLIEDTDQVDVPANLIAKCISNLQHLNLRTRIGEFVDRYAALCFTLIEGQIDSKIIAESSEHEVVFKRVERTSRIQNRQGIDTSTTFFLDVIAAIAELPNKGVITDSTPQHIVSTTTTKNVVAAITDEEVASLVSTNRIATRTTASILDDSQIRSQKRQLNTVDG